MVEIGMACWHTSLFWEFRNCRDLLATLRPGNWRQPRQRRRGNCRTTITPRWCRSNFVRQFQSLCCRGWSLILHTTGEGRRIAPCHALVVHDRWRSHAGLLDQLMWTIPPQSLPSTRHWTIGLLAHMHLCFESSEIVETVLPSQGGFTTFPLVRSCALQCQGRLCRSNSSSFYQNVLEWWYVSSNLCKLLAASSNLTCSPCFWVSKWNLKKVACTLSTLLSSITPLLFGSRSFLGSNFWCMIPGIDQATGCTHLVFFWSMEILWALCTDKELGEMIDLGGSLQLERASSSSTRRRMWGMQQPALCTETSYSQ